MTESLCFTPSDTDELYLIKNLRQYVASCDKLYNAVYLDLNVPNNFNTSVKRSRNGQVTQNECLVLKMVHVDYMTALQIFVGVARQIFRRNINHTK